jgi:hypothetical protein
MGLLEDVRQLSEQLRRRQAHVRGEEATKQSLVLPFLQTLGFDVYDPTEVQPELVSDFVKKRQGGPSEKVDYAIQLKGELALFIECKAVDVTLDNHGGQLSRYFNATTSVKTAVLTNGLEYRFFTDLQTPNVMDPSPFFTFNVLSFGDREVDTLRAFTKEAYDAISLHELAEELIFTGKVTGLVGDMLRNPSENFVRFLLSEADLVSGRVTARVVDKFTPIVRRAIQTTLVDMMTKSLQHEIAEPATLTTAAVPAVMVAASPAAQPVSKVLTNPEPARRDGPAKPLGPVAAAIAAGQVYTTEEETRVYEIVKRLCAESAIQKPINYKDTVTYFGLNLGKVTHWFLRFVIREDRRYAISRLPVDRVAMLAPGFKVESTSECPGGSRVHFRAADDLDKLRSFILHAYEEEARRRERGAESEDDEEAT